MEIFFDASVWKPKDFLSPSIVQQLEPDFLKLVRFGRAPFQQRRRGTAWTVRRLERCLFIVLCYLSFVSRNSNPLTRSRYILGFKAEARSVQSTKKRLSQFLTFLRQEKKLNSQSLVYAFQALADYFNFVGALADQLHPRQPDEDPVRLSSEHFDAREMGLDLPLQVSVYAEEQARQFGSLSIFKDYSKPKADSSLGDDEGLSIERESVDTKKKHQNRFGKLSTTEFAWLNSWQALLGAQVKAILGSLKEENKRWRLTQPLEKDLKCDWMDWTEAINEKVWQVWKTTDRTQPASEADAKVVVFEKA